MGSPASDPDSAAEEQPQRRVAINQGFWIGRSELSQSQWTRVMGNAPWSSGRNVREGDNFPAVYVTYDQSEEFCRTLTRRERQSGNLPNNWEFSIPTEEEWEYACRSGETTRYSFGESAAVLAEHGWFARNASLAGQRYAHEVCQLKPNRWNIFDMHGNVWEWCRSTADHKPYRGGSWMYPAELCRSASRGEYAPEERYNDLGIRLVLRETRKP